MPRGRGRRRVGASQPVRVGGRNPRGGEDRVFLALQRPVERKASPRLDWPGRGPSSSEVVPPKRRQKRTGLGSHRNIGLTTGKWLSSEEERAGHTRAYVRRSGVLPSRRIHYRLPSGCRTSLMRCVGPPHFFRLVGMFSGGRGMSLTLRRSEVLSKLGVGKTRLERARSYRQTDSHPRTRT